MDSLHAAPLDDGRRPPHPVLYTMLIVPFGATSGFVSVALAYLATKFGLSVEQGASLIAVSLFPNVWKFFWAPVGDRTLSRKKWYLISCAACAIGMFGMAVVPLSQDTMILMDVIIAFSSIAATFLGFAVEGLVAHITPPNDRGRVSGWFQAGNLGGGGIGGGLGLWLLDNMPAPWVAGGILAVLTLACAIPLLWISDVKGHAGEGGPVAAVKDVALDMWAVLNTREGILCALLCFVPIGTGAAQGVLVQSEVAAHWIKDPTEAARIVEMVQGFITGLISMAGCLVGGWICNKWLNARASYAVFGGIMAAITGGMAMAPATPNLYIVFSMAYAFATGLCYAAFSAFVLDAIGAGHAATKYNGFASLSNFPIWYCGLVLAWAQTEWGPSAMLWTESLLGVAGIVVFTVFAAIVRNRAPSVAVAPSAA
jgi:hypothetical protein